MIFSDTQMECFLFLILYKASTYCSRQLFSSSYFLICYLILFMFSNILFDYYLSLFNSVTIQSRLSVFKLSLSRFKYLCFECMTYSPIFYRILMQVFSIYLYLRVRSYLNELYISQIFYLTSLKMSEMLFYSLACALLDLIEFTEIGVAVFKDLFQANDIVVCLIQNNFLYNSEFFNKFILILYNKLTKLFVWKTSKMSKKTISKNTKEQDQMTSKIFIVYRKKCQINGIQVSSFIKQKLEQATAQGALENFQTSEQLGSNQARAFIESLDEIKYKSLKILRIWKAQFGNEGARVIAKYLLNENSLQVLDLLDNEISSLGCQFLGRSLLNPQVKIKQLKLDNNLIGSEGLKNLSIGLRTISTLDKLSLKYCNIDIKGSRYIQQIIANIKSKLRSLKLQGNPLENEGVYQVLRAVKNCGQTLQKLNIADVRLNLLDYDKQETQSHEFKVKQQMVGILKNNILIVKFECRFNQIHDHIAEEMLQAVQLSKNIKNMEFPNNVKYQFRDRLDTIIRARKKKGKKSKKT